MSDEQNPSTWLDTTVIKAFPRMTVEVLIVSLILLLALVSRFYDLGARVMSHDETNHVVPSYDLYQGRGYLYDPISHGPLQFQVIALSYYILGDSDFSSRVPAAVFSIATIVLALFGFRRYLGRAGSLIAGFLFLISPYMLFYGRYARDEVIYILWTFLMFWAMLRYLETAEKKYLYATALAMALNFVTMESAFIYTAQALIFIAILFVVQITRRKWNHTHFKANFITTLGACILLVVAVLGGLVLGKSPVPAATETAGTTSAAGSIFSTLTPAALGVVLIGLVGAILLGIAAIFFLVKGAGLRQILQERSFNLLALMGFLVFPLLSAFPAKAAGFDPLDYSTTGIIHSAIFLVPMIVITIIFGWWWNPHLSLRSAAIFYVIYIFFYTTFFTAGAGFFKGVIGGLGYWTSQQEVNRGTQPWYYYAFFQVPYYEFLPAAGALLAVWIGFRHRLWTSAPGKPFERPMNDPDAVTVPGQTQPDGSVPVIDDESQSSVHESLISNPLLPVPTLAFFIFWIVTSLIAFSIAGEKMPWLTVNPDLPLILAAAWGLGYLVERAPWNKLATNRPVLLLALLVIFLASLVGTLASLLGSQPPFQGKELAQLQNTSTFIFAAAALVASGYFLFQRIASWKWFEFVQIFTLAVFAFLAILTVRISFRASFINYDNPKEFLVYAHGAPGSKDILSQVEKISFRTTGSKDIAVAYDNQALYPFWWYFRDYPNKVFFTTPTNQLRNSPIVVAGEENYARVDAILGEAYYKFDYTRMWWPVEIYQNLTWDRIIHDITNPQMRAALWDIWSNANYGLYAQLTNRSDLTMTDWWGSKHFAIYIRKDITAQIWEYGAPQVEIPAAIDPYASGEIDLPADLEISSLGSMGGSFNAPHQIAFAQDGSIYVADSRNNRIVHLSSQGQLLQAWGTPADVQSGDAPGGTFNEPWGVAVGPDGSVYVADTFNYRIQKFTAEGTFIKMWGYPGTDGSPDAFYGPRGLAVDALGQLFVTDTGNKRVVVFDANGNIITQFGGAGIDPGQFDEPVGIALDSQGDAYVADTWNQRVQVFSPDSSGHIYSSTTQWNIAGWYGTSIDNKPFIAVNAQRHIFVTDPEASQVLEFDNTGNFIRAWGQPGSGLDAIGLASGIAIDSEGHVWVSDAGNNRLLRYTLPE